MPDHIHVIIVIVGAQFIAPVRNAATENQGVTNQGAINRAPTQNNGTNTVGEIVRAFKARCTHAINRIRNAPGVPLWQRNYYEHIIRKEPELHAIREYIRHNPLQWDQDEENPARRGNS
jgi:REP element-mobilizing transposase RayT